MAPFILTMSRYILLDLRAVASRWSVVINDPHRLLLGPAPGFGRVVETDPVDGRVDHALSRSGRDVGRKSEQRGQRASGHKGPVQIALMQDGFICQIGLCRKEVDLLGGRIGGRLGRPPKKEQIS